MTTKTTTLLIIAVAAVLVISQSVFIVTERQRAVLLRFGEVVVPDVEPGLHFMIPVVNKVRIFDGRLLTLDARSQRYLTFEKKALIVDSYLKWRVSSVEKFYTAASGDEAIAARLLASRVDNGLRREFGERTMQEVVSGQRDLLMDNLTEELNGIAQRELGIEVLDVRVKKIDLPPEVGVSVFNRMASERERIAREYRAQGQEAAEVIKADADRQRTVIEAEAYRDAEKIRGEGDAIAAATYASAFKQEPEFYSFYRSLNAYRTAFGNKGDLLVLEPDGDFFKYFNNATVQ